MTWEVGRDGRCNEGPIGPCDYYIQNKMGKIKSKLEEELTGMTEGVDDDVEF